MNGLHSLPCEWEHQRLGAGRMEPVGVRRCRVVGIAYIDDGPGAACEFNWMIDSDDHWSFECDWVDGGRVAALSDEAHAAALLRSLMRGPQAPTPQVLVLPGD